MDSRSPTRPAALPEAGSVPPSRAARDALRRAAADYVRARGLQPPVAAGELAAGAEAVCAAAGNGATGADHAGFAAVLVGNEVWRASLAAVPFQRRLLLLPQCLRSPKTCRATTDGLGLVCARCGGCPIGEMQARAEALGYAVLVAEGSAVVTGLLATGRVGGIVGVSCLSMLERVFPQVLAAGIPAVAVPLLYDGCVETDVDVDWALEAIDLQPDAAAAPPPRAELDVVAERARAWFAPAALDELLGPPAGATDRLARDWVARAGKRWRPILAACTWRALATPAAPDEAEPPTVRAAAVAVECFHKASLVHDDIEDADELRYGEPALHVAHGVPIALNVGDLLLGEGYRLLAGADLDAAGRARMLAAAAGAHRKLCLGQGTELQWARRPRRLDVAGVLEIFRNKTAPAFAVALQLGAICAGADGGVEQVLQRFSDHLGVAYQIRDDLDDLRTGREPQLLDRPSILAALARRAVRGDGEPDLSVASLHSAEDEAVALLEEHRTAALEALEQLESPALRDLLRQVVGRILPPAAPPVGGPEP